MASAAEEEQAIDGMYRNEFISPAPYDVSNLIQDGLVIASACLAYRAEQMHWKVDHQTVTEQERHVEWS
ncbi:uncharacterized protein N7479_010408 [Penicillium vulpinum]|uniref:uncharacterized protein n=1 Tax=Penicillium vulpinum TaxID=29845 RepID=UPI00254892F7|nr:uncharacterized protein N7479_010408 [Penicillium vulpinum]KAJ5951995.1 hypothetical protein N7479_010408 [Penicillium vulpinum]